MIQETKNLMNAVAKVVTICFICATKVCSVSRKENQTSWLNHCSLMMSYGDVDVGQHWLR